MWNVRRAAVLGAGVMGAQIAALLAGAGIPVELLDMVPDGAGDRDQLARRALRRLSTMKPAPAYQPRDLDRIRPGNFADHLDRLRGCDWVLEAVVEDLAAKRELFARVAPFVAADALITSNTSGLPVAAMAAALPAELRPRFFGTHFFNPPRYLRLLEVIPGAETAPERVAAFIPFVERVLGKGVVVCKDTPYFIANRIVTYGLGVVLAAMTEFDLAIDAVDAITGPAMGRPKTATFQTADLVGMDTVLHVLQNLRALVTDPAEQAVYAVPDWLRAMADRGWLGRKAGQGFYKREGDQVLVLDPATLDYRPRRKVTLASLAAAQTASGPVERVRALLSGNDVAAQFAWRVLRETWLFAASRLGEIAERPADVDRALELGLGWEMGPFALWDALGVAAVAARMEGDGMTLPPSVRAVLDGPGRWYPEGRPTYGLTLGGVRAGGGVVRENTGATLLHLGEGVLAVQMHSPKDAIGPDVVQMLQVACEEALRPGRTGLVIASESQNFCVGANLFLLVMAAQEEEWDDIDLMVRQFQKALTDLKFLERPVVAAPSGMALGGGAELCLAADQVVAHAETYIGLVEVGAGLIPAGGGCKEMLLRQMARAPQPGALGGAVDRQPHVNAAFETIALAKVATSAREGQELGLLADRDRVVMNRDHLLAAARDTVVHLYAGGAYRPPVPARIPVTGADGRAVLEWGIYNLLNSGRISDHDARIGRELARVLTGGDLPAGTEVDEAYLLDLEREAFVRLCREPKTQARMLHLLQTGKPLRN